MEGENKFDPNEIPNMVAMLVGLYQDQRQPTAAENQAINHFYMRYMSKAMEDCQKASSSHWLVARPQTDIALQFKTVDIPGESEGYITQFVVATVACMASNLEQFNQFKQLASNAIVDQFGDDDKFKTIYNKMAFNGSPDLAQNKRSLCRGLWIGCRLSEAHFVAKPDAEAPADASAN
jgi:hypothetical protein